MNAVATPRAETVPTLANSAVLARLGDTRAERLYRATLRLDYGTEWIWNGRTSVFTAAGLRSMAEFFAEDDDVDGAELLRQEADKLKAEPRCLPANTFTVEPRFDAPSQLDRRSRQYKDAEL